jgi:type VI secretion system protein ImpL
VTNALHTDDAWVLGSTVKQEDQQQTDNAVRQLYARDFISQWDSFLSDIALNNSANLSQRINTARLLSGNSSPLRQLVVNLSQVLTLTRDTPEEGEKSRRRATAPAAHSTCCLAIVITRTLRLPPRRRRRRNSG